jgi:hypothetical protein
MIQQYVPDMEGCSDGNCIFRKNTGMVTNGGCSCMRELNRSEEGAKAVRTILFLRRGIQQREKEHWDCSFPGGCVCGGDTPRVREGCGYFGSLP